MDSLPNELIRRYQNEVRFNYLADYFLKIMTEPAEKPMTQQDILDALRVAIYKQTGKAPVAFHLASDLQEALNTAKESGSLLVIRPSGSKPLPEPLPPGTFAIGNPGPGLEQPALHKTIKGLWDQADPAKRIGPPDPQKLQELRQMYGAAGLNLDEYQGPLTASDQRDLEDDLYAEAARMRRLKKD